MYTCAILSSALVVWFVRTCASCLGPLRGPCSVPPSGREPVSTLGERNTRDQRALGLGTGSSLSPTPAEARRAPLTHGQSLGGQHSTLPPGDPALFAFWRRKARTNLPSNTLTKPLPSLSYVACPPDLSSHNYACDPRERRRISRLGQDRLPASAAPRERQVRPPGERQVRPPRK